MKKILALLLASLLLIGLFAGCAKQETAPVQQEQTTTTEPAPAEQPAEQPLEQPENTELPTITFVHGYYHDESEWAAAAQMRQIYQDFADLHKDEFNFVAVADESGAEGIYNTALNDISRLRALQSIRACSARRSCAKPPRTRISWLLPPP